jgi:hypothetical protein
VVAVSFPKTPKPRVSSDREEYRITNV